MRISIAFVVLTFVILAGIGDTSLEAARPNILWICVEDASPHIGCYGETTIKTPRLDKLAAGGVRFDNAFVTCPVCSPSRSAMVSGMYQTTLGAHNHRSQNPADKAGGNEAFYDSYRLPSEIKLVPELFAEAGYYVVNGGTGKTDYNFITRDGMYAGKDWKGRRPDQPFFAQVQLRGGKFRKAKVATPVDPADVQLPPYYPDDPVIREDWAEYLNSWQQVDLEVGELLDRLTAEGIADSTAVFFWTDHGISHLRGKQFLYDEGIRVPLIVRLPGAARPGQVRTDLVSHIDIAAASLGVAGIPVPDYIQGRPLFAEDHQPREFIFAARDRCDETVDAIRCIRTPRYKYIRNFLADVSHMQPNQYKDGKAITQRMRLLLADGKLNELQSRIFADHRPPDELYDLQADPHETVNLATRPEHAKLLAELRERLYATMAETRDVGLIPEPILEVEGRRLGSKYLVGQQDEHPRRVRRIVATIEAGERHDASALAAALRSEDPAVRYWAAAGIGNSGERTLAGELSMCLADDSPAVQVAAAKALCQLGETRPALDRLASLLDHENLIVGFYAIRAFEQLDKLAGPKFADIRRANHSDYDSTQRIAKRLTAKLAEWGFDTPEAPEIKLK